MSQSFQNKLKWVQHDTNRRVTCGKKKDEEYSQKYFPGFLFKAMGWKIIRMFFPNVFIHSNVVPLHMWWAAWLIRHFILLFFLRSHEWQMPKKGCKLHRYLWNLQLVSCWKTIQTTVRSNAAAWKLLQKWNRWSYWLLFLYSNGFDPGEVMWKPCTFQFLHFQ